MKNIEAMEKMLSEDINEGRYIHSINVMNTAVELAKIYNVDIQKAKLAGLLHDCGRLNGKSIGSLEHAELGCKIASEKYEVNDIDILNAIRYHTTGRENMTMLDKIIYIADKIEPTRNYNGVECIRKLAYEDIDMSIIKSINNTIDYLKGNGIKIDNKTVETLNYLLDRRK